MERRARPFGRISTIVVLLSAWLTGPHDLLAQPRSGSITVLVDGPTRWLMLPEEERQARRLRSVRQALAFTEDFWRRRDPDPEQPGNETVRLFNERVEAADRLYGENGERGSMTDRGRALVLLGAPPVLRYSQRRVPVWQPGPAGSRPRVETRNLMVETWVYPADELPPPLAERLAAESDARQIELSFAVEPHSTHLVDGEKYLLMAARALVVTP